MLNSTRKLKLSLTQGAISQSTRLLEHLNVSWRKSLLRQFRFPIFDIKFFHFKCWLAKIVRSFRFQNPKSKDSIIHLEIQNRLVLIDHTQFSYETFKSAIKNFFRLQKYLRYFQRTFTVSLESRLEYNLSRSNYFQGFLSNLTNFGSRPRNKVISFDLFVMKLFSDHLMKFNRFVIVIAIADQGENDSARNITCLNKYHCFNHFCHLVWEA